MRILIYMKVVDFGIILPYKSDESGSIGIYKKVHHFYIAFACFTTHSIKLQCKNRKTKFPVFVL